MLKKLRTILRQGTTTFNMQRTSVIHTHDFSFLSDIGFGTYLDITWTNLDNRYSECASYLAWVIKKTEHRSGVLMAEQ